MSRLRRTWLFVPGADEEAHEAAARSVADVLVQELEDFRAAGVEAIDCPYTFSDVRGAERDARWAKQLGYRMKSLVTPEHAAAINRVFTPQAAELAQARRVVEAFEKARASGRDRAMVGGKLVEVPIYAAAKRLLESSARTTPSRRSTTKGLK